MNNFNSFKLKMLMILTFCVFMTFSMLIYFLKIATKCENSVDDETCLHISKNPVSKATHIFFNVGSRATDSANQLPKPLAFLNESGDKYTAKEILSQNGTTAKKNALAYQLNRNSTLQSILSSAMQMENNQTSANFEKVISQKRMERKYENATSAMYKNFFPENSETHSDIYEKRRLTLHQLCPKYLDLTRQQLLKQIKLNHILIDETHKILYCYVPKVACTNWKRIFLILTGKAKNISEVINLPASEIHAKNLFKTLQNFSATDIVDMTKKYTKFIFVRHPFERLLSAFRNKLEQHYNSSKYFQTRFGKYIIKNFRKNPTNVSLAKGDDVTFSEFVSYIVSSDPSHYNEHWQRVTDLCHPCLIRYDFIGKYDTLEKDSNYLLKQLGLKFDFPLMPKPSTTSLNLKKYYDTLERTAIYNLFKIYEMDFRLFGYDLADLLKKSSSEVR